MTVGRTKGLYPKSGWHHLSLSPEERKHADWEPFRLEVGAGWHC